MRTWEDFISELRVWRRGKETAVHKPLLLLLILGQAKAGGSNRFAFRDLVDPLQEGLAKFGPSREVTHPEYPFWHLQDPEFWVIEHGDELFPAPSGEPSRQALLEANATALVPAPAWEPLLADSALVEKLARVVLRKFWADTSLHAALRRHAGLEGGYSLPGRG